MEVLIRPPMPTFVCFLRRRLGAGHDLHCGRDQHSVEDEIDPKQVLNCSCYHGPDVASRSPAYVCVPRLSLDLRLQMSPHPAILVARHCE
jgi:hypothetical protein